MKRINKVFTLFLIVLLSTPFMLNILQVEGIEWVWYDNPTELTSDLFQTRAFYSNYTNRFYSFFNEHETDQSQGVYYSTSFDGVNWLGRERLDMWGGAKFAFYWGRYLSRIVDFYLEPNGRYLHHVMGWTQAGSKYLTYQRYELFLNGTMKSQDYYEFTYAPFLLDKLHEVSICADSEGYPYISVVEVSDSGTVHYAQLLKCEQNNGTWLSHTKYSEDGVGIPANADYYKKVKIMPLENQGIHWFIAWSPAQSPVQEQFVSFVNYWDGSGWHMSYAVDDAEGGDWADEKWCLGWYGNLTVLFSQDEFGATDIRLTAQFRDGKNSWENRTIVSFEVSGDGGSTKFMPLVSVGENLSISYIWGILNNETLWYRQSIKNSTTGLHEFQSDPVEWQDLGFNLVEYEFSSFGSLYSPMVVELQEDNTPDFIWYDFLGEIIISFGHLNTTLYNSNGEINDGWIFRGETYTFESYFVGATTFELNFTDGEHDIEFTYENATQRLSIQSDDQFIVGEYYFNITHYSGNITKAIWGFIPNTNIVDIENTTTYYNIYNEELNATLDGSTGIIFNIYNLGGFTYYTFVGDGGRTTGGTPFQLYATNGTSNSTARAEQIYRKLQHINFLLEIDMGSEWDTDGYFDIADVAGFGYIDIGFDYRLDGSWIEGFKIKLYVVDANVGHHNLGVDHNWVEWKVDFYNYDPSMETQICIGSQLLYTNHWGYEHENYDPDYYNRTSCQLWVDLWFDRTNASTTIASQVNAYYRGMKEQGSAFWFGYGVFVPMISDYDNAKFLDDLYDETGNITNCQKFDLIKFYVEVGKIHDYGDDANDETWTIRAIEDMHREQAIDRMEGIDEPTFVEAKILDMPQTGFINAIKSALGNIANSISQGIFFTLKSLWAGVGWIFELMGLKSWYDALSLMIGNIATASMNFMDSLELALLNSALLLEQIFRLFTSFITRYTALITDFISSILSWYTAIIDMFSGGGVWSINIWMSLSIGDWFGLVITLSPVIWLNRLNKQDDWIATAQSDISFMLMLVTGLFHFLSVVIMLSISLLSFLIGLLPI